MGFGSVIEGAAGLSGLPGADLVAGLLAPVFETKSVAGLDRSAGRLFRAGAPVIVASAMYRRGGTGADFVDAAVSSLGIRTAPEPGQTKKGYASDPPVRVRDDTALKVYLRDAAAGRDSGEADSAEAASHYDWVRFLRALGVPLESSDAPGWLKRKAAPTAPAAAVTAPPEAASVAAGSKSATRRSIEGAFGTGSGIPWWVWLLFPLAAAVWVLVWVARRLA